MLGTVVGTSTALLSKYSRADIADGLYGFNGALVGLAAGVFFVPMWPTLFVTSAGAALSTWIARAFRMQARISGYTMPFVLATWAMFACAHLVMPHTLVEPAAQDIVMTPSYIQAFFLGVGQVMFQASWVAGALFLVAVAIQSRLDAAYAMLGSLLCLLAVWVSQEDFSAFNLGLFGYNAVLCAIALGDRSKKSLAMVLVAVLLSVILQIAGMRLGVVTLTAPFVIATWIVQIALQPQSKPAPTPASVPPPA